MSSVARRAVLSVGKILVQPKVITTPFGGSTRHAVSQVGPLFCALISHLQFCHK